MSANFHFIQLIKFVLFFHSVRRISCIFNKFIFQQQKQHFFQLNISFRRGHSPSIISSTFSNDVRNNIQTKHCVSFPALRPFESLIKVQFSSCLLPSPPLYSGCNPERLLFQARLSENHVRDVTITAVTGSPAVEQERKQEVSADEPQVVFEATWRLRLAAAWFVVNVRSEI